MNQAIIVGFNKQYAPQIRRIRNAVFTDEQGIDASLDFEGGDPDATHVLVGQNDEFVGTGRLLKDGHIGRLAVLKASRGNAFGAEAVNALVVEATRMGMNRVFLGAQKHAVGFYLQLGFVVYGEPFMDAGIEHVHMEKAIQPE